MRVKSTVLDNGMTILTDNMPSLETAAMGVWVKSGSRSERQNEHGISHLLEHMAFKGTTTRSSKDIAEAIENVGGELNAATSVEHTGYFARVLKDDVALAADLLSDILQNSVFEANELQREQHVIVQEIGASRDDPDDQVFDMFQAAAYPDQAMGRTILGTAESVGGFKPDDLRTYMDRNYVGDQMILVAAGNVDHDALVDLAADRFSGLKSSGSPEPTKANYIGGDTRSTSDHEQVHMVIGLEGRAYNTNGYYAAQVLSRILGGGMSSRLFQEVREKRGLCYSVYSFHWAFADSGIFGVAASTGADEISELVPVVLEELAKAALTITEDEVVRVRNQIRAGLLMSLESPSSRAGQLARQQILWGRPIPLQETVDRISAITADRVKKIAGEILDSNKLTVSSVGPVSNMPHYDAIKSQIRA